MISSDSLTAVVDVCKQNVVSVLTLTTFFAGCLRSRKPAFSVNCVYINFVYGNMALEADSRIPKKNFLKKHLHFKKFYDIIYT